MQMTPLGRAQTSVSMLFGPQSSDPLTSPLTMVKWTKGIKCIIIMLPHIFHPHCICQIPLPLLITNVDYLKKYSTYLIQQDPSWHSFLSYCPQSNLFIVMLYIDQGTSYQINKTFFQEDSRPTTRIMPYLHQFPIKFVGL